MNTTNIGIEPGAVFQSTPAIAGGRMGLQALGDVEVVVSIHARHCWRANEENFSLCGSGTPRFNPRPPLLAGECPDDYNPEGVIEPFQSTPAIAGGRMMVRRPAGGVVFEFQSTPAIAGGRMPGAQRRRAPTRCFNPRPSLLAGDCSAGFTSRRG